MDGKPIIHHSNGSLSLGNGLEYLAKLKRFVERKILGKRPYQ